MSALDSFLKILGATSPDQEFLIDTHYDVPGIKAFPVAHIATDLVPQVDHHLNPDGGSQILIIGFDGACISEENYRWTSDVMRWASQGNDVKYLLLAPSTEALKCLEQEIPKAGNEKGSLQVVTIDRDKVTEAADAKLVARWESFHFVSFDNPRQLWVENFHPPGTDAHDCTYFPPIAAEKSPLWSILTSQFRHIVEKYGRVLLDSVRVQRVGMRSADNSDASPRKELGLVGAGGEWAVLPCPFCGHAPTVKNGKVKCLNETCKVQPRTQAWYCAGYETSAGADWNGRGGETAHGTETGSSHTVRVSDSPEETL